MHTSYINSCSAQINGFLHPSHQKLIWLAFLSKLKQSMQHPTFRRSHASLSKRWSPNIMKPLLQFSLWVFQCSFWHVLEQYEILWHLEHVLLVGTRQTKHRDDMIGESGLVLVFWWFLGESGLVLARDPGVVAPLEDLGITSSGATADKRIL